MSRNFSHTLIAVAGFSLLTACSGPRVKLEKCHKPQEYQQATIGPQVKIPEGLKPLDPEQRLEIPYGPTNTTPTPPSQPCLVEPPPYLRVQSELNPAGS
jgi:uncharacterized lipoprotein